MSLIGVVIETLLWIVTILGSILGVVILIGTLLSADGAPQQASGAAVSVALAVIPYCVARAVTELRRK